MKPLSDRGRRYLRAVDTVELAELDRKPLWHPFTQQRGWEQEAPVIIERAEGTTLYDTDGNAYIDGISSLWCNVHGHRHPEIDAAVRAQLDRVAHTTMLGLSHPGAASSPSGWWRSRRPACQRVFYSDNGSTAVEVALKMAYQYWQQRGETQRDRVRLPARRLPRRHDRLGLRRRDRPVPRDVPAAAVRDPPRRARRRRRHAARCSRRTASASRRSSIEPLVQGAAGMLVQPAGYLRAVRELCDEHGVLLICDEVAVGFGRTGTMFACEQEDVAPDLMCVAKGITGGYLPLAATLTTEAVYTAFLGEPTSSGRSSTATRTRATRSPARPRWRRSTSSSPSARWSASRRRSSCWASCSTTQSRRCADRRRDPAPRLHDRHRADADSRSRPAWATR